MSNENIFGTFSSHLIPETTMYQEDQDYPFIPLMNSFQMYNQEFFLQDGVDILPIQDMPADALNLTSSFSTSTSNSSVLTEPYDPVLSWTSTPYQHNMSSVVPHFEALTIHQMPKAKSVTQAHQKNQRNKLQDSTNRAGATSPQQFGRLNGKLKPVLQAVDTKTTNQVKVTKKQHVCGICGRPFKRPQELERHQVCHTGERKFICTHSGCQSKGFARKDALTRHSKCHTTEKINKPENVTCGKKKAQDRPNTKKNI